MATPRTQEYIEPGYGPSSKGATGTKGKIGANTRAADRDALESKLASQVAAIEEHRANNVAPVKLGLTEIEYGDGQYHRPGIIVGHGTHWEAGYDGKTKGLSVVLHVRGRTGKQVNYNNVYLSPRDGNRFEVSTGGAGKSTITLAEWQAFVDTVDVRVSDVSKNTVGPLTPALVKMARDVVARRRKSPTDAEWTAETRSDGKTESAEQAPVDIVDPPLGVVTQAAPSVRDVAWARANAEEVMLDYFETWLVDLAAERHVRHQSKINFEFLAKDYVEEFGDPNQKPAYDETCGMEPREVFERRLLTACFVDAIYDIRRNNQKYGFFVLDNRWTPALVSLRNKRMSNYWAKLAEMPEPAVLSGAVTADLLSTAASLEAQTAPKPAPATPEQVATMQAEPAKTTVKRNGHELLNPRWESDRISGLDGLAYDVDWGLGVSGNKNPNTGHINSDTIAHLIKTGGLIIEGEMPQYVRDLIEDAEKGHGPAEASPEERASDASDLADYDFGPQKLKVLAFATELTEATRVAIAEPHNADAQKLPRPYYLERKPNSPDVYLCNTKTDHRLHVGVSITRGEIVGYIWQVRQGRRRNIPVTQAAPSPARVVSVAVSQPVKGL